MPSGAGRKGRCAIVGIRAPAPQKSAPAGRAGRIWGCGGLVGQRMRVGEGRGVLGAPMSAPNDLGSRPEGRAPIKQPQPSIITEGYDPIHDRSQQLVGFFASRAPGQLSSYFQKFRSEFLNSVI